jgi:hypothetical protein
MTKRTTEATKAAILDDYRAGIPTIDIAAKYGISDKTVNRYTREAGLRRMRNTQSRRATCQQCGKSCLTGRHLCRTCERANEDDHALTDGHWANVGGIMRWFPNLTAVPDQAAFDPDEIACLCGATVTKQCRTKTGQSRKNHAGRKPRRCPCGGELNDRQSVCRACAREAELAAKRLASKRDYERRKAAVA